MSKALHGGSVLVAVLGANEGRDTGRVRRKLKRMASSPFAFFRGSCPLSALTWCEWKPPDAGPEILICGDLHLENFGAYRDDAGEFLFDVNDFDEAIVGPCAIDPVRCATSILLASELWRLSPLQANGMVIAYLDEYRSAVTSPVHPRLTDAAPRASRGPIGEILGRTALGDQVVLLDEHTERLRNGTRRIARRKKRQPELGAGRAEAVSGAVEAYGQARGAPEFYRVLDVTGRVAGIGSLGLERFLVLVAGGGSAETNRLLDVKEERPSSWTGHAGRPALAGGASEAARVVHAQRTLQARPAAGLDVLPVGGTDYRVRELIPEENRSSLDRFQEEPSKLRQAIVAAGRLTGLAHLRGARAEPGRDEAPALVSWATGPALDSLLAGAARQAELTRVAFDQFRAELKAPDALPEALRGRLDRGGD